MWELNAVVGTHVPVDNKRGFSKIKNVKILFIKVLCDVEL
jgi:hypothetical protein